MKNFISIINMFPYTSGSIHVGHARNFFISDTYARSRKENVFMPIGFDSFGLPAENASIIHKISPSNWTENNIKNMKEELKILEIGFNWESELSTSSEDYYIKTQEIFIRLLEKGFIYRKKSWVFWDEIDQTVLANEQIINGKGWRSGEKVYKKLTDQWFFRTEEFAEELLEGLKELNEWPKNVLKMQEQWIGCKSRFKTKLLINNKKEIEVFSEFDELFEGARLLINPDIEIATQFLIDNKIYRIDPEQEYISTDIICKDNNGNYIPVYITDLVKNAVIKPYKVISIKENEENQYKDNKINTNKKKLSLVFEKAKSFKIRDWCISRQRIWGTPIPVIFCENCKTIKGQINKKNNKIRLSCSSYKKLEALQHKKEILDICKECKKPAISEIDSLDTFFDSSWYFLRYFHEDLEKSLSFIPVDVYVGGIEHAILHLIYSRMFILAFKKLGLIDKNIAPFKRLVNQGLVLGSDGKKMSKSKGNAINIIDIIKQYGSDTIRLYILADKPISQNMKWDNNKVKAFAKNIERIKKKVISMKGNKNEYIEIYRPSIEEDYNNIEISKVIVKMFTILKNKTGFNPETFIELFNPIIPNTCKEIRKYLSI